MHRKQVLGFLQQELKPEVRASLGRAGHACDYATKMHSGDLQPSPRPPHTSEGTYSQVLIHQRDRREGKKNVPYEELNSPPQIHQATPPTQK